MDDIVAGPVTNCLDRSIYGQLAGREGWACRRCGGYHDANGEPLVGPCSNPACSLASSPGGRWHDGPCMDASGVYGLSHAIPPQRIAGHQHVARCFPTGPGSYCPEWSRTPKVS